MTGATAIAEEVRALARLDLEGLRAEWRRRYGAPPKVRSPDLLRLSLAWRVQASRLGGLSTASRRGLRASTAAASRSDHLRIGARITREWRGEVQEVEVSPNGFAWHGASYASLSAVARAMTGVKRNGPKFFGLRAAEPGQ